MRLFRGIEGFEFGDQRGNLRRNRKCRGIKKDGNKSQFHDFQYATGLV